MFSVDNTFNIHAYSPNYLASTSGVCPYCLFQILLSDSSKRYVGDLLWNIISLLKTNDCL